MDIFIVENSFSKSASLVEFIKDLLDYDVITFNEFNDLFNIADESKIILSKGKNQIIVHTKEMSLFFSIVPKTGNTRQFKWYKKG